VPQGRTSFAIQIGNPKPLSMIERPFETLASLLKREFLEDLVDAISGQFTGSDPFGPPFEKGRGIQEVF